MENRAKLRFPRSLISSLTSCRAQNLLSDVIHRHQQNPIFSISSPEIPHSSIESLFPPSSPVRKPPNSSSYPSLCRPRFPETFDEMVRENCILSGQYDALRFGKKCPPVSPLKRYSKLEEQVPKKSRFRRRRRRKKSSYEDLFSSDDEREDDGGGEETETETETLFSSSRSFLSLSSDPDPDSAGSGYIRSRRRPPSAKRREARKKRSPEVNPPPLEEKVKGSFAVVKRSSDPYTDFRTSMVEMIMEKQIFGAKELEQLLQCFLSLNPHHHHRIIVQVFAEICDALFSNLC